MKKKFKPDNQIRFYARLFISGMCVFTWAARCCAIKGASYGNTAGIKSAFGAMALTIKNRLAS